MRTTYKYTRVVDNRNYNSYCCTDSCIIVYLQSFLSLWYITIIVVILLFVSNPFVTLCCCCCTSIIILFRVYK